MSKVETAVAEEVAKIVAPILMDQAEEITRLKKELEEAHRQILKWNKEGLVTLVVGEKEAERR